MNQTHRSVGDRLAAEGVAQPAGTLALRYGLEDKPAPLMAFLFGMQHVLIMFGAMIAAPIVIGQLLNLPADLRAAMITGVMIGCGAGTIVSALGLGWIGGRLPLLLGAYTVYIAPVTAIARTESLGAAAAALVLGGLVLLVASPAIGKLRRLFPPLVVGILLLITGVSLVKIAVNIALGANTPNFGRPVTFLFLAGSILLIIAITHFVRGVARSLSIFMALIAVYGAAYLLGLANTAPVLEAPWFHQPSLAPFGFAWPSLGAIATVIIYHLVSAIYTLSITLALCRMVGTEPSERRVRGAVAADGLGSVISTLFGGVPLISYDQNVGAISLTGVGSRFVVAISGVILIVMALVPKIGAIIGMIPPFALGGTLIFMFGMIVAVGVGILAESLHGPRDTLILAASVGLSAAVSFAPQGAFDLFPPAARILAADGIIVGTLVAVLLNALLPGGNMPAGNEGRQTYARRPVTAEIEP